MAICPTIETTGGFVKGKVVKATDPSAKPVYNFLGIPYGKPPVGKLRFLAPQRSDPWKGTLEAIHTFNLCPQDISVIKFYDKCIPYKNQLNHDPNNSDEDCLHLNIFTPNCNKNAKMPVMVWLTGGHYQRNFGGRRNGTPLAGMCEVVVVTLNFRVNAFGFFSLGKDSCCPGNAALLDVILALEWVQDNISAFGGDPCNVTLFGESSGSGMVHLLMMSALSKGLFHKAILMSGCANAPAFFDETNEAPRNAFLSEFGLDRNFMTDEETLTKLQEMHAEKILQAVKNMPSLIYFSPTIDNHVIKDSPMHLLSSGNMHRIPLMLGCTNSEGSGILSMSLVPGYCDGITEETAEKIFIENFFKITEKGDGRNVFEMIKKFYQTKINQKSHLRNSQLLAAAFSDIGFVVPTVITGSIHSGIGNPTFLYQMTQRPEFNHSDTNGPEVLNRLDFVDCDHADDLHFLWGEPFEDAELSGGAYFTKDEIELSRQVMKYFTNFAKTGNPNKPVKVDVEWPQYSSERDHMVLQIPLKTDKCLAVDQVAFYQKLLGQK